MKQCSQCKDSKPFANFYKASRRPDGYQDACKACANRGNDASRRKNWDYYKQVRRDRHAKNTALIRAWKVEQGCKFCDELEAVCLELHHLNPNEKERDPSEYAGRSFTAFLKEAKKCVVVCANCHRKVHAGLLICD